MDDADGIDRLRGRRVVRTVDDVEQLRQFTVEAGKRLAVRPAFERLQLLVELVDGGCHCAARVGARLVELLAQALHSTECSEVVAQVLGDLPGQIELLSKSSERRLDARIHTQRERLRKALAVDGEFDAIRARQRP